MTTKIKCGIKEKNEKNNYERESYISASFPSGKESLVRKAMRILVNE